MILALYTSFLRTSFFTKSFSLLKSTATGTNLSTSILSTLRSKHLSWWRRLEDVLIKTNIFTLLFRRRLQDVFSTSSRRFQDVLPRCLQDILRKRFQDVFKTSSRFLENVFKKSCKNVFKTSSRRIQDVLKTSSRCIIKLNCLWQRNFKTSSRRIQTVSETHC